ncbi:MAG: HlyC/CorC family transporter [Sphingobacteriales bacterium]|nr:MAG: HlyC/CorC family transporter [Sphingobacteriales bacterium]
MGFDLALTIFLVLLNGFFVAAEFAIVKVRTSQVEVKGNVSAANQAAKNILANLDGYLAATQLGITLASLGLGWVGERVFEEMLHGILPDNVLPAVSTALAFTIITILHITFGELAPKSLAIRKPLNTTLAVALPLKVFYLVFRPAIWLLNGFANLILRMIGMKPVHEHEIHSEEELRMIVSESHEGGVLEDTEREIIHNAFDLGERKIASLMTQRSEITWLDVNDAMEVTRERIVQNRHHMYPLCEESLDEVIGYLYAKDLVTQNFEEALTRLKEMARPPLYVPENNTAFRVLERFKESKVHQALVVDEFGSVKGLVTINDIFDALVGDISEENEFQYEVVRREDGSILMDAQIPFEDFLKIVAESEAEREEVADGMEDDDFVTIGGYVVDILERIPQAGDRCQLAHWTIEVMDMDRSRIDKVLIQRIPEPTLPEEESPF